MIKRAAFALAVLLTAGSVRAEECPNEVPEDPGLRRALAKKWFSKGESEVKAGNDLGALKAYQCSLTFVPHGFTAYNIAQIAEKVGDLEVAIAGYGQYLLLVPDAKDAKEIGERVDALKERLEKVRESEEVAESGSAQPPPQQGMQGPQSQPFPEATATEPKRVVVPPPVQEPEAEAESSPSASAKYRKMGWIAIGGGGVLILGGVLSNVLARGQMDTCRSEYLKQNQSAADSACNNAKPLAYLSYSLFGLGAAAIVAGGALLFIHPSESSDVGLNVLPEGGLSLRWAGTF